jgi:hypothetical protein
MIQWAANTLAWPFKREAVLIFGFEGSQHFFGGLHVRRRIDRLEVGGHRLTLLPAHVLQRVAHQVNNALLHLSFGIGRLDCFRKAGKTINTSDQYILNAPIFQLGQNVQPELSPLVLANPHAIYCFVRLLHNS